MTARWMLPPEIERAVKADEFDPVRAGEKYRLPRELSLAIWKRVCDDATDSSGRRDAETVQQRFHELAKLIAARGGRLVPDVGRHTRVGVEIGGVSVVAQDRGLPAPRTPGRETLVGRGESASQEAEDRGEGAGQAVEPAQRREVADALAALMREAPVAMAPLLREAPGADAARRDGALPDATRVRMEQAYGQRFDDVEVHVDSPEVPFGQEAFTRGRHIHFERGAFDPESAHGEHVIAHELAHVAQQERPGHEGRWPGGDGRWPASRAALEADAHQAALAALAGRAATVHLFAPTSAALGFSNGAQPPYGASGARRPPAVSTRGAGPAAGGSPGSVLRREGLPGAGAQNGASPNGAGAQNGAGTQNGAGARAPASAQRPGGGGSATANAATTKGAGSSGDLLMPEAPSALTPTATERLQRIRTGNQGAAAATTQLPTGQQQTDVARAAVEQPRSEQDAHAQHAVVAAVDDRPPPSPEIELACARIQQVIRDKRPPDEDKLVEAKPKEMAQEAGTQMSAGVEQRAATVRQGYADVQQPPPGRPETTPVPATLPPERAQVQPVDATAGAPDALKPEAVSLEGDVAAQRQRIQDAGMNTEAGQLVKDGPIGDARGGAEDLQAMAGTDPQKVLAEQTAAIANAKSDMRALQAAADKALADARAGAVAQMAGHTTTVKGSEEQQRATAGAQMQNIFSRTQQTIDDLLRPLSGNAVKRWEAGVARLSTEFESALAETKSKIEQRHSGIDGWVVSGWDAVAGLPDWVTADYDRAEARFGDGATSLIRDISRDVNAVIESCKKLIDQARKDIEAVVNALPANLRSWAQGEADRLGKQLDQLGKRVDQTQSGLDHDLVDRAGGAVQQVRERVAQLREDAKGLIGKIADAIAEFAKNPGRAIINGLLRIVGIPPASFWALVEKLGDVIAGIAAAPLKFANTLMAGVGKGFQQFFDHLPANLGKALFGWLFGKLGEAGVSMPADFSLKSILTLVLEVMGITWTRIKTILAKHIGAQNAEILDQAMQLITVLIEKGPQGVFEMIQEQLDPSMIIDAIKDAAIQYVIQAVITRVAVRIMMMLNPAGAILQAIEAIYRVIKWVINNAARIFTLIESVVNGAAMILAGDVSGVAGLVEASLVRLITPVIDFLADYLGLGGIPDAIKKVILGLQSRVEKILDKVIGFIAQKAKGLWAAARSRSKPKAKDDKGDPKDKGKGDPKDKSKGEPKDKSKGDPKDKSKGDSKDKSKDKKKPGDPKRDSKPIVETFTMHGEPHQLIVQLGPGGHFDMASKRERLSKKVGHAVSKLVAKRARPEQIAELKAIGEAARNGDRAAAAAAPATAPTGTAAPTTSATPAGPPPATNTVAQQIAAYGTRWQVHDLHEVAVTAPQSLVVPRPVHLAKLTPALAKELAEAANGQVIYSKPGDPKQVASQVIEKHKDAKFDFATAALTLPALKDGPLLAAKSAAQVGQLLGQQTGVSSVTLRKTEQTDEVKLEFVGEIGASATLGTAVVKVTDEVKALDLKPVAFDPPYTPNLIADISKHAGGDIYSATGNRKTQIDKAKKATGTFDKTTGTLKLQSVNPADLQSARTVSGMGERIGTKTLAGKAELHKSAPTFTVKVGFESVKPVDAVTGKILMTPEQRIADFHTRCTLAVLQKTDRYKPASGGPLIENTSEEFRNKDYVAHFPKDQDVKSSDAESDLSTWLSSKVPGVGQLSRVGSASAVTYIIVDQTKYSAVVVDDLAKTIDPSLHKAVMDIGIVPFMKAMAQNQKVEGIDRVRFNDLWKQSQNRDWLANRFRTYAASAGMHEWIPSSTIPKSIERAATLHDAGNWLKGEKWIDLHHEMRTNTKELIGKPAYWEKIASPRGDLWLPQGHDGAIEHVRLQAQTKNFGPSGPFHTALFDSIETCKDFSDCIANAKKVFIKYIWNDEEPKLPIDPEIQIRGVRADKIDMNQLKAEQKAFYAAMMAKFDALAIKYPD